MDTERAATAAREAIEDMSALEVEERYVDHKEAVVEGLREALTFMQEGDLRKANEGVAAAVDFIRYTQSSWKYKKHHEESLRRVATDISSEVREGAWDVTSGVRWDDVEEGMLIAERAGGAVFEIEEIDRRFSVVMCRVVWSPEPRYSYMKDDTPIGSVQQIGTNLRAHREVEETPDGYRFKSQPKHEGDGDG